MLPAGTVMTNTVSFSLLKRLGSVRAALQVLAGSGVGFDQPAARITH